MAGASKSAEQFAAGIDDLVGLKALPPDVGAHIKEKALQAGPTGWSGVQEQYTGFASQYQEPVKLGPEDQYVKPSLIPGGPAMVVAAGKGKPMVVAPNATVLEGGKPTFTAPPVPGTGQRVINGQLVDAGGQPIGEAIPKQETLSEVAAREAQIAAAQARIREIDAKLAGTIPMSAKDKAELAFQRQRLSAQIEHWKSQDTLDNPEAPASEMAKAIAAYQVPAPQRSSSARAIALMNQVMRVNPSYDASQFPVRQKMRLAYTSGNQSQQLTALNTALEHLGKLDDVVDAVKNGSFKPGNEAYNWLRTTFGDKAVTNMTFARDIMSGELATAMKKSGATDQEIEKVTTSLSTAGSPEQLHGAIRDIASPMIGGKASTMEQQYKAIMGEKDPFSVYTPGAKKVIEKLSTDSHVVSGPKEGETRPITEPGYPSGAEMTYKGGKWIRTK